ncbi:MAG: TonB-dependent receptor [Ferruginibacter sp.]
MRNFTRAFLLVSVMMVFAGTAFSQVVEKGRQDTTILQESKDAMLDNIPVISLDENEVQDGSAQNISSQLSAGRDPFLSAASFHFNAVRFRIRGYDADLFSTYMNGAPMENLDNGFTPYGLWGGLNDVLRNRDQSHGLRATPYALGDIGGLTSFDTRASHQRKQTSFNYALSNRNYTHRIMATHNSGLNKKGWAYSISGSRRWADEGYTDGTYYNGWSGFLAVDKKFNDRHLLSFTSFATPTENGRQGPSLQEMRTITGDNFYNPYWGYQNGKKRNSSIAKTFQPVFILTHDWKINDKTTLVTAGSYIFGKRSTTALDWYNSADPRPDYYRYLPSYYANDNPAYAAQVLDALKNDVNLRQVNWDRLYNVNRGNIATINDVNGIAGNNVTGKRSLYIVQNRVINTQRANFNTVLNTSIAKNIDFTSGGSFQYQKNHYYNEVNDLLGGDFYVDLNQFAERDFPSNPNASQNDLNRPNRILQVGDEYGNNYDISIKKASVWAQAVVKFRKVDFFIAAEHSYTNFFRNGRARVGLFADESYGKSKQLNFYNYSFKGGVTYKIDGRNYLFVNGAYLTRAPFFENAFIAPRTRNTVQDNLQSEKIQSAEAGYAMNAPRLKIRLTGFYTKFEDQSDVITFYDDFYRTFGNFAISNIGKEQYGLEFGVDAKVYKGLSVNAGASVGSYKYNTRQNATTTIDNSSVVISNEAVYSKGYNVGTPQEAYTIGLDYRSPRFWFVNVNFNYFRNMWLQFSPARRTDQAVSGVAQDSELWHDILDQEKLDPQYTLDAFAGYSWMMNNKFKSMKKRTYLVFNVGVNNILNNTDIVTGGFEQLRFDYAGKNVDKFPSKKFFAYGLNYFASIGLRF